MCKFIQLCLFLCSVFFTSNLFAGEQFSLSTSAFQDQGAMPVLYTCDGKNISPQIAFTHPPAKTKSFAIIMSDPSAPKGTFYHWILYNIPSKTSDISQGMAKPVKGVMVGTNDFDKKQYSGPCPPKGSVHTYIFTVYALDSMLPLKNGASAKEVLDAMQHHVLEKNKLTALYSRFMQ